MRRATNVTFRPCRERCLPLSFPYAEKYWSATRTRANREKRVTEPILPWHQLIRHRKDGRTRVQALLVSDHVFVRLSPIDRGKAPPGPRAVRPAGVNEHRSALPEEKCGSLKKECGVRAGPCPHLTVGRRLRVKADPFAGLEGIAIWRKGSLRVAPPTDLIQRSTPMDVEADSREAVLFAPGRNLDCEEDKLCGKIL